MFPIFSFCVIPSRAPVTDEHSGDCFRQCHHHRQVASSPVQGKPDVHAERRRRPQDRSVQPGSVRQSLHSTRSLRLIVPVLKMLPCRGLHRMESTVMHRFSRPGVFTVGVECATSDWRVAAQKTVTVQEPVRQISVTKCYGRSGSTHGTKCYVLHGTPVQIQVMLEAGEWR